MSENMPRIRSSVIVGLGGTGALAALHAKRALTQFYEKIPYNVKFLILDTDRRRPMPLKVNIKGERWEVVKIEESEFLPLSVDDPLNLISVSDSIKKWWPKNIPTKAILNGAGGYRARGRLAFHAHAHEVESIITNVVESIMWGTVAHDMRQKQGFEAIEGSVDVYVLGSLAGGTGSGSFIDAGFLFQKALQGIMHKVIGFFLLPSVFEGLPTTFRVNMNGYAALKELDHYFEIDYLNNRPRFTFGDKEIEPDSPPFHVFNLMDAVQEEGQVIPGKRSSRGVDNLCQILGEGVALNVGNIGEQMESACDNLYDHIVAVAQGGTKWGGKMPHYSTIGVSSIIYPIEKHFNQLSTYYAYGLIDKLLSTIEEGVEDSREKEVEDQVNKCITEASLGKKALMEKILSHENLVFHLSSEGIGSAEDVDEEVKSERKRKDILKQRIVQQYEVQLKTSSNSILGFLHENEQSKGVIYSRKAAEKIAARFTVFRDELLQDIQKSEDDMTSSQQNAEVFYDETVKKTGWRAWKRSRVFQEYLDQMGHIFSLELNAERQRKTLSVFAELIRTLKEYLENMGLGAIETKLSEVRQRIEEDYFGTSQMVDHYGQYSLILYHKEIFVDAKDRVHIGSDKELVMLPSDFAKLQINDPDSGDFLETTKTSVRDLEIMNVKDLQERIVSYAQKKVSAVRKIDIEKMLNLRKEGIEYWLKEASRHAVPYWRHNAAAEMAAMQEEIFILGVTNEHRTLLKDFSFADAKYEPTLMSTSDPYKLFFFKYKAPVPAYLLTDMERCRLIYLETPIEATPHIQDKIELELKDLFLETPRQRHAFPLYLLAMSGGLIQEEAINGRFIINNRRCLEPGQDFLELGYPAWRVFEDLKRDGRENLRKAMGSLLKEEIEGNPEKVKSDIEAYYQKIKETFDKYDTSMNLGDEILLHRQIKFLDEFFYKDSDLKGILE